MIKIFKQNEQDKVETEDRLQVDKKILIEDEFEILTETILRGHSNWSTSSCWISIQGELHLVTSSMDKSVIVWSSNSSAEAIDEEEEEQSLGTWPDVARIGDFGGANMGFLGVTAGRSDSGKLGILAHSYNGAFYLWWWNEEEAQWKSSISPSGHFGPVRLVFQGLKQGLGKGLSKPIRNLQTFFTQSELTNPFDHSPIFCPP